MPTITRWVRQEHPTITEGPAGSIIINIRECASSARFAGKRGRRRQRRRRVSSQTGKARAAQSRQGGQSSKQAPAGVPCLLVASQTSCCGFVANLLHFAANSLQLCWKLQHGQVVLLQFATNIIVAITLQFATKNCCNLQQKIVAILLQFATKNCCKSCIKIATTPFLFVANCRQILLQIATNCNNYFCRKIAAICKQNMLQIATTWILLVGCM